MKVDLPEYKGIGIQMMPYLTDDPYGTIPDKEWAEVVARITDGKSWTGVGYATIDEAVIPAGITHRSAGLHVDAAVGHPYRPRHPYLTICDPQIMVASEVGCRYWQRPLSEPSDVEGGCNHLRHLYPDDDAINCEPNVVYEMGTTTVHESYATDFDRKRQFLRITPPCDGPWSSSFTPSPFGIQPAGPIIGSRTQINHRNLLYTNLPSL